MSKYKIFINKEKIHSKILIIYFISLFKTFKELSFQSYQVLRKNVDILVILLRIMLCTGIPELKERFISNTFNIFYNLRIFLYFLHP